MAGEFHAAVPSEAATRRRWPERAFFFALVLAYLLPVWLYRYLPTQDGPSHLANAVIVRDYGGPGTRHHEFFTLSYRPFPNWTSHLALAALSRITPPRIAEKILVTCYVLGFAFACRFFLAPWPGAATLAPLCLLFVFNRCWFMGFYNYCLSLPLAFLILGICVRLPERPSLAALFALTGLFVLTYFTHLVGYAAAAVGALVLVLLLPGSRRLRPLCLAAALLPSAAFLIDYLTSTDVHTSSIAGSVGRAIGRSFTSRLDFVRFWSGLRNLNGDTFNPYETWSAPIGLCWLLTYGTLLLAELCSVPWPKPATAAHARNRLPVMVFGVVMLVLYLSVRDDFGRHGGFMKPRLALWLPVLALALLKPPTFWWLRYPVLLGCYALAAVHLAGTCNHFDAANRRLAEYTAGIESFGRDHVMYVVQAIVQPPGKADYISHASDYYCLDSRSTSLDNYEATTHYFPVRFRPGIPRGGGSLQEFSSYPRRADVDRILVWDCSARPVPQLDGYSQQFHSGCLTIYARTK